MKGGVWPAEIKAPGWLTDKHTPTVGTEEPRNGDAGAVYQQVGRVLTVDHCVLCSAAVVGMHTFTQPEERCVPDAYVDSCTVGVESDFVAELSLLGDKDGQRIGFHLDGVAPALYRLR